jgi:hypothetical protein
MVEIKHLFERHAGKCSILSAPGGRHSHSSSIEPLFDLRSGGLTMAVITNNKAKPLAGGRRVVGTRHNDAPEHPLDHAPTSARLERVGP